MHQCAPCSLDSTACLSCCTAESCVADRTTLHLLLEQRLPETTFVTPGAQAHSQQRTGTLTQAAVSAQSSATTTRPPSMVAGTSVAASEQWEPAAVDRYSWRARRRATGAPCGALRGRTATPSPETASAHGKARDAVSRQALGKEACRVRPSTSQPEATTRVRALLSLAPTTMWHRLEQARWARASKEASPVHMRETGVSKVTCQCAQRRAGQLHIRAGG